MTEHLKRRLNVAAAKVPSATRQPSPMLSHALTSTAVWVGGGASHERRLPALRWAPQPFGSCLLSSRQELGPRTLRHLSRARPLKRAPALQRQKSTEHSHPQEKPLTASAKRCGKRDRVAALSKLEIRRGAGRNGAGVRARMRDGVLVITDRL